MTETMQTDPTTGGQKGSKPEQPSLIPVEFLETLSRVYSKGLKKYQRDNWRRGYRWSLSYDALQRHLMAFWKGEDLDEDGEPHLAHAAWHCATLIVFMKEQREKDDRWKAALDGDRKPPQAASSKGAEERDEAETSGYCVEGEEDPGHGVQQARVSRRSGSLKEGWWQCQRCFAPFDTFEAVEAHERLSHGRTEHDVPA